MAFARMLKPMPAASPPRSLPRNIQFFRPIAHSRVGAGFEATRALPLGQGGVMKRESRRALARLAAGPEMTEDYLRESRALAEVDVEVAEWPDDPVCWQDMT